MCATRHLSVRARSHQDCPNLTYGSRLSGGVFEGTIVGEMARRVPNPSPFADWSEEYYYGDAWPPGTPTRRYGAACLSEADVEAFLEASKLPQLLADAILSVPIDLRTVFASKICVTGRRMIELVHPLQVALRALLPIPSEHSSQAPYIKEGDHPFAKWIHDQPVVVSHGMGSQGMGSGGFTFSSPEGWYPHLFMDVTAPYAAWVGGSIFGSLSTEALSKYPYRELHRDEWISFREWPMRHPMPPRWAAYLVAPDACEWKLAAQRRALRHLLALRVLGRGALASLLNPHLGVVYILAAEMAKEERSSVLPERTTPTVGRRMLAGVPVVKSDLDWRVFSPFGRSRSAARVALARQAPAADGTIDDCAIDRKAPALMMLGCGHFVCGDKGEGVALSASALEIIEHLQPS